MLEKILDFIYPRRCISCDQIISASKEHLCDNCKIFFKYIEEAMCVCCGGLVRQENVKCRDCIENDKLFTKNIPIFVYEDLVQDAIYRFKYGKKAHLGKGLGSIMAERLFQMPNFLENLDYIVPIPIHRNRMKTRGFNQAELLAKEISKVSGIPMGKNLIVRIRDTAPQSKVSFSGRKNNLKGALEVNKRYALENKSILLVDDIYTTGNTLNACCEVLYKVGVKEVRATTLSIVVEE